MRLLDTDDGAREVQLDVYRAMTPDRRTELAIELSEDLRAVTLEGIASRNPGCGEAEMNLKLVALWHGDDVADAIRALLETP